MREEICIFKILLRVSDFSASFNGKALCCLAIIHFPTVHPQDGYCSTVSTSIGIIDGLVFDDKMTRTQPKSTIEIVRKYSLSINLLIRGLNLCLNPLCRHFTNEVTNMLLTTVAWADGYSLSASE